jgi:hypothetical protein
MTTRSQAAPVRRKLRFSTVDEALAEASRLAADEREGRLDRAGNWTLGQSLNHLAAWAGFAFDGYPPEIRAPLPVRVVLRLMKNKFLRSGMPAGVRIRNIPAGTLGADPTPTDVAFRRFESAFGRLRDHAPGHPNPIFGRLSHDEWVSLNLRHAELHLGFLVPR